MAFELVVVVSLNARVKYPSPSFFCVMNLIARFETYIYIIREYYL